MWERLIATAGAMILFVVCAAIAPAAQPPTDPQPLRGPSVTDRPTIIHQDMTGRFGRVEGRPEEAAILELHLNADTKELARQVIEDRATELNRFLAEQVDLLKAAADSLASGDRDGVRRAGREMFERFPGSKERDPLLEPLRKILPQEAGDELKAMVDEYWSAWIASEARAERDRARGRDRSGQNAQANDLRKRADGPDRDAPENRAASDPRTNHYERGTESDQRSSSDDGAMSDAEPDGMMELGAGEARAERLAISDSQRERIQARLVEQLFNEEVRRAYERVIQPLRQKMERVYQVTEPSPEQREAIRAALIDYIRDGRLRPTEEQRRRLVERIYEVLNQDQRLRLFEAALSQI